MTNIRPVKGTRDIWGADQRKHRHIVDTARATAERYGFEEVTTPCFEHVATFDRTLGETSDAVMKEMYRFETQGGDKIALRPDNTAGFARAFLSNGWQERLPVRGFYAGPQFRHERPQAGRYRQFTQIGIECLGIASPIQDVECIACGVELLDTLGLDNLKVELNTLGDEDSRNAYRHALVDFLSPIQSQLSPDSQTRLSKNPLRILDSKDPDDQEILRDAPIFEEYLNQESKEFYEIVKSGLDSLKIPFIHNDRLVRGLDYYSHTVFEVKSDGLGSQSTILAGGRYDGLIKLMGGPPTPGVGWAAGVDRLSMLSEDDPGFSVAAVIMPMGNEVVAPALHLAKRLRNETGLPVTFDMSGNLKKRFARANKIGAKLACVLGEDELSAGTITIKRLETGTQETASLETLSDFIRGAVS